MGNFKAPDIHSDYAWLDVKKGRAQLRRIVGTEPFDPADVKRRRIPVTIRGYLEGPPVSKDDGISQEFEIHITSVQTGVPANRLRTVIPRRPSDKARLSAQAPLAPIDPAPVLVPQPEEPSR